MDDITFDDSLLDDEREEIATLSEQLIRVQFANAKKWAYYDGEAGIKNIGIAIPETMINVESVVGWSEIVVDTLDERLDWIGWEGGLSEKDLDELNRACQAANLIAEFDKAKLDPLVTGVGFLSLTAGDTEAARLKSWRTRCPPATPPTGGMTGAGASPRRFTCKRARKVRKSPPYTSRTKPWCTWSTRMVPSAPNGPGTAGVAAHWQ